MILASSVLPTWVAIPVAVFAAVGTIAGAFNAVVNADEAWHRIRRGATKVAMKVRRRP